MTRGTESRPRALISVSDKTGVAEFGRALVETGWELLSTGGTARVLADAGVPVTEVAQVTGHPEMMDGRVKTLHPAIHAGILARRDRPDDMAALAEQGYRTIDLVAVNLYPFRETVADPGVTSEAAMESVDIGGPAMVRAAAKNHRDLWVVIDPADYVPVLQALAQERAGDPAAAAFRRRLAAKVFRLLSSYDQAVAAYLSDEPRDSAVSLRLRRSRRLRYGENPDQTAAFYVTDDAAGGSARAATGVAALKQLQGKELSYNNILDVDGALLSLAPFAFAQEAAVSIVKHTTPCGLALRERTADALRRARETDSVSAFGSVIATNRPVDRETAEEIRSFFVECVVAPGFTPRALELLSAKKQLRLLTFPDRVPPRSLEPVDLEPADTEWWRQATERVRAGARFLAAAGTGIVPGSPLYRSVYGGMLAQSALVPPFFGQSSSAPGWRVVTRRNPTDHETRDLAFAWAAVAAVKSNAILLAKDAATVGIGTGQTSRVDSSRIAVQKARDAGLEDALQGAVLASDAFFPFRDGVDAAAEAGVTAIVHPGGSIRDDEVIGAADEHEIAMVVTGRRLFRH